MPLVGFDPTIPVFERAKAFHALGREATVTGRTAITLLSYIRVLFNSLCLRDLIVRYFTFHALFTKCARSEHIHIHIYIGETGRPLAVRLREHKQNLKEGLLEKSKLAQHAYEEGYRVLFYFYLF
jgi:hypothetical protein